MAGNKSRTRDLFDIGVLFDDQRQMEERKKATAVVMRPHEDAERKRYMKASEQNEGRSHCGRLRIDGRESSTLLKTLRGCSHLCS